MYIIIHVPLLYHCNDNFGTKLFRQIVGIPMGTDCASVIADLLFCHERDFMASLSYNKACYECVWSSVIWTSKYHIPTMYFCPVL